MIVLALSASVAENSLCIADGDKILIHKSWGKGSTTSEELTFHLQQALKKLKMDAPSIKVVAVDRGPGSFTGCRMAVNAARTLAYANSCRIIAFDSLEIMAWSQKNKKVLCLIDAHRGLFYGQAFDPNLKPAWDRPQALPMSDWEPFKKDRTVIGPDGVKIDSKALIEMAAAFPQRTTPWEELEPLYIRAPDAVEKLKLL